MKNLQKFLPLFVFALLILAACTNPLSKEPVEQAAAPSVTEEATEPVADEASDGTVIPIAEAPESRYDSDLDCSALKQAKNRDVCEAQVNDLIGGMLEAEILASFDMKRCKELPEEMITLCETQITDSGIEGPVSDADMAMFNEAVQGSFMEPNGEGETPSLFPSYDSAKCAGLTTPGYKKYCEELVGELMAQAQIDEILLSDDVSRCDELESEEYQNNCKRFFGVEVEPVEPPEPLEVPPGAEVAQ